MGDRLINLLQHWVEVVVAAAPKVVLSIVLFIGAIMLARFIRRVLAAGLRRANLDALMARAGADAALKKLGVDSLAELLPRVVYVLLLVLFAGAAADVVGLTAVVGAVATVVEYLPNVAAAVLLLFFGSWAAQGVGNTISRAAAESGMDFGNAVGKFASTAVLFVFGLTAVSQLKIDTDVVRIVTTCGLAGFALAFGLSTGLGSRDMVRNILAGFYLRKLFQAGDRLRFGEVEGVLKGVTAVQTLIETEKGVAVVPNATLVEQIVEAPRS
ncbi:MAG: mechanosensitive ion channel [Myxococcales bacterium]|nr:mechanosensitive ion channel [Myxococcales bacterium]